MWFRNILRRDNRRDVNRDVPVQTTMAAISSQVWRQLDRMRLGANPALFGQGVGRRPSSRRKPAMDFREHRKYVPGDDVRYVDWQASARHEQIFLKQGEQKKETTVYLLVDTSASMAWGDPPKYEIVLALAAAIAYLVLANDDRLQIIPLAGDRAAKGTGIMKGKGQFPGVMNFLPGLQFGGGLDLSGAIRAFSRRVSQGGRIILLSDLLGVDDLPATLKYLPAPTWDVTLIHTLHPSELTPEIRGHLELVDFETGAAENYDLDAQTLTTYGEKLLAWRSALELASIEKHAFYTLISTGWSLEKEIIPHLRQVRVFDPLST